MYEVKNVSTMDDVFELLGEVPLDGASGRYRRSCLYRGLPNSNYLLQTTLYRNCGPEQGVLEEPILRNFAKYAAVNDPSIEESIWRQLFLGQHHGLPTRLLDWTYSPLIGLYFALSEGDLSAMSEHDCALWKIDIGEFNQNLPSGWLDVLKGHNANLFTLSMLEELRLGSLRQYDEGSLDSAGNAKGIILVEPPSIDMRIVNQYSYFSIMPISVVDMDTYIDDNTERSVKYVISKDLRWKLRDMLDGFNISERMAFPGLDGLCMWLKRHYYVVR